MIKLRINNVEIEAREGSTLLSVAESCGFKIPVLCNKEGLPHYSSCMVCLVKNNKNGAFIPSCSALVQEGMDIDVSGSDVTGMRRNALELLLSEHRAECEAQCRIVCPMNYNIPVMNRLLASENTEGALLLVASEMENGRINCTDCKAYCENACRRKKIDAPISIRNTRIFLSDEILKKEIKTGDEKSETKVKRFSSRTGKLADDELREWLKECIKIAPRHREMTSVAGLSEEASSCMHCDCRAVDDCKLRTLAEEYSLRDPAKIINHPVVKKINKNTGLIFENAKCIKCGLCVRICEDSVEEPALCFINRGFVSIISEPLTTDFDEILRTKSSAVVEICPTGALSFMK